MISIKGIVIYYIEKGMVSLGDIYKLMLRELEDYKKMVKFAILDFIKTVNLSSLVLFIVWGYEYLEAYASTELCTNAKKSVILQILSKTEDNFNSDLRSKLFIDSLFDVRAKLVHRPYLIDYTFGDITRWSAGYLKSVNPIRFLLVNKDRFYVILNKFDLDIPELKSQELSKALEEALDNCYKDNKDRQGVEELHAF